MTPLGIELNQKMTKPKIVLKSDVNADVKNCITFVNYNLKNNPRYIKWFLPDKLYYISKDRTNVKEINRILRKYTEDGFKKNKEKIEENVKKAKKGWEIIEKKYFNLVNKIFKNHPWPKGIYTGFASIFTMYPRDIKNRIFFFPGIVYTKRTPPATTVIGHEMLHFIFFDYIDKKYNLKTNSQIKGKDKDYLWKISEVFNSVIESWNPYYQIFKFKTPPYTGKNFYKKMRRQWVRNPDIDKFLDKWLKN